MTEELYETPEGYYDVPYAYAFDASSLTDGANYPNLSILIQRGFGDFVLRRIAGIQGVVNPSVGQYQIRDAQMYYFQTKPVYAGGGGIDDYPITPEKVYPETNAIRFDLYDILRADPPIAGTYKQSNFLDPALNEDQGNSDGLAGPIQIVGTLMIIGGIQCTSIPSGAILVYNEAGGVWGPDFTQQIIGPYSAPPTKNFGSCCATDGTTIAIGAPSASTVGLGSVYIYTLVGEVWTQQQVLTGSGETAASDLFGTAIWVNGNNMLIGAPGSNDGANGNGAVYYFTKSGGVWTQAQKFTQTGPGVSYAFGGAIAVSGTVALIGALGEGGSIHPYAYFFNLAAGSWTQAQGVTQPYAGFGSSVAFGSSGTRAYIATGLASPAAFFVYDLIAGAWTNTGGFSAGSQSNANYAICGTDEDVFLGCTGPGGTGAIYHFANPGSGFSLVQIINATTPTASILGQGIALAPNGTTLFGGDSSGRG